MKSTISSTILWMAFFLSFPMLSHGEAIKKTNSVNEGIAPRHTVLLALTELQQVVEKTTSLSPKEISSHTNTLTSQSHTFAGDLAIAKALMSFISSYEKNLGPLWLNKVILNPKEIKDEDRIHWAAFWAMQHFFDQIYTAEGLTKHLPQINGFKFKSADYFPGKVDPAETILSEHKVSINGSYLATWGPPVFHMDKPARKPTGAYLLPGSVATVIVPDSLVGKGYEVRVGAHSWDLKKKKKVLRLYRVSAVYPINQKEVQVANPLGGGIYIEVPYEADAGVVEIKISNVVRSPYFSMKSFHMTTLEQWRQKERNFKSPWADFQSGRFMMQVPTSWIYQLEDPVSLMEDWDKAIGISNKTFGRPEDFGKEMIYPQVDTQLRGRAFHPGYPSGNRGYDPLKDYGGYHDNHLVRGPQYAHSYEFHEQGHGYMFPKYSGDREAAVNLPFVAVLNRGFDFGLEEAFRLSRGIQNKFVTLDTTAIAWMMSDHFLEKTGMEGYERQYQAKGHAKFVDIVRLFGWEIIDNFFKSTNQDHMDGKPWSINKSDGDKYTLRLSKIANADLRPLIHFWGIPTENLESSNARIKEMNIRPSSNVWDLLHRYKTLIPKNKESFQDYAKKWWEKQPSPEGFTTQRNHAARWESYDEKMVQKTSDSVQEIIDTYFPAGRPD